MKTAVKVMVGGGGDVQVTGWCARAIAGWHTHTHTLA